MRLTKIDVAEAHLNLAVRSFFSESHPASVLLLAGSSREILTSIGIELGITTFLHDASNRTGYKLGRIVELAHANVNFMKHADKNPDAVLEDFDPTTVAHVLFVACHDFGRVAKGMSPAMQIYEAWYIASNPDRVAADHSAQATAYAEHFEALVPGFRTASDKIRRSAGLRALQVDELNPNLRMKITREVRLPIGEQPTKPKRS